MMRAAVIDASVAVKAVTLEDHSDKVLILLRQVPALHAPAHWLAEAANALWAKVAIRQTLAPGLLTPRLRFLSALPIQAAPLPGLVQEAGSIAVTLRITIYDALYLALAAQLGAPLVSDDRKLVQAAEADSRFAGMVVRIADLTEARA